MSRADDLSALREQCQAGRRDRAGFVTNLSQIVVELTKANQAKNKERRRILMEILAAHETGRKQEAGRLHKTRVKFVANLVRTTVAQRKANAAENAAARSAWLSQAT